MQPLLLRIRQQHAIVGIRTTPPRLSIQQPRGRLEMKRVPLNLGMHTEYPKVLIDQVVCFEESGLKGVLALIDDIKQHAYGQVMDAVAKTASDGDRLGAIENGGNPIAEIGFENGLDKEHYFDVAPMPRSRPRIEVQRGKVSYNVTGGRVEINYTPRKPVIDVVLGDVDIHYKQRPYIEIRYVGNALDRQI